MTRRIARSLGDSWASCRLSYRCCLVSKLDRRRRVLLPRYAMLARHILSYLSVHPSQAGIVGYLNDWTNRADFWHEASLHMSVCCREIWISPKIGYFLWDFVPNSGLRKFRQGKSIALSTKLVVFVDSRVCWWHLYENRRVVAVYYKSVNCNPLTQLLRLVVDFSYKLFYSWQDFDWHSALRGPAAVAELVDNAVNLPWRNYLSPEFGTKSHREVP